MGSIVPDSINTSTILPGLEPSYVYSCPNKKSLFCIPPRGMDANGLLILLHIPSLTSVVFPLPGGPCIAIQLPEHLGLVIC